MKRLFSIPEPLQGDEHWLLVSFCIPDTASWRGLITGWVDTLTYGRAYDGSTGNIRDAQAVGREIFSTMGMCNLDDIAVAINDVVNAINNIQVSPQINIDCGGCGGCQGGTDPPPPPGAEIDAPPPGWEQPPDGEGGVLEPGTAPYLDRKCKAANMLHDGIREFINQLVLYGVEQLAALGLTIAATVVFGVLVTLISGPIGFVAAVLGGVPAIVLAFIAEGLNAQILVDLLDSEQDDLVCSLYQAQDAQQAIDAYVQILEDAGANTLQINLILAVLTYASTNALFFKNSSPDGDEVEDEINGYVGGVDCDLCSVADWSLTVGALVSGSLQAGTTGFVAQSEFRDGGPGPRQQVSFLPPDDGLCYEVSHSISTPWVNPFQPGLSSSYWYPDCTEGIQVFIDTYTPEAICIVWAGNSVTIRSANPFEMTAVIGPGGGCI